MRDIFIAFLVMCCVPAILFFPHLGVYAWSWISYMNPHRLGYGFVSTWPVAEIVGIATLVAWVFSKEPKKLPMHTLLVLIMIFMAWISFTTWLSSDPALSDPKWDQTMKILLFTLVTAGLITTKNRLVGLIWIIVLSLGFYGAKGGVFTIETGGQYHVWGPAGSFISDNNQLAMALVMTIPLMRFLQMQSKITLIRWGLGIGIGLTIFAIFGTQSRGALLAIIAMLGFLVLKSRRRAFALMASVLAVVAALVFMPQSWTNRMMTIDAYQKDQSAQGRIEMWKFALNIAEHNPVTGGSFMAFANPKVQQKYLKPGIEPRAPHSIYFETLGEHGYVGLAIFLSILIGAFYYGGRTIRLARGDPDLLWARDLGSMIQVSLVGYAVAGAFLNLATFDLYYHLIAIIAITDLLVRTALAHKNSEVPAKSDEGILTTMSPAAAKPKFTVLSR